MSPAQRGRDDGERDLARLLSGLRPERQAGVYRFASAARIDDIDFERVLCFMHEPEGISIVAQESAVPPTACLSELRCCWITLKVYSSLAAVGLTAAVADVLAEADIACNVVAGTRHDHLFVPLDQADQAMALLEALQRRSAAGLNDGARS
ncbi:hypothetical protein C84B14_06693 [Salinisphaera sp. C84B14]|uniref:ACT domain-containing protein n=1 Tax=Salinisphaera sp. C84B14 TaxID=1304155 RepID=UPI0032B1D7CE